MKKQENHILATRRDVLKRCILFSLMTGGNSLLSLATENDGNEKSFSETSSRESIKQEQVDFPMGYDFSLVTKIKRDARSYTQGLVFEVDEQTGRDILYESGGRYNQSLLRKVDAQTGDVLNEVKIPSKYFAEGLAAIDNRLYLLTWRERKCFVYDKKTFEIIEEFSYQGEGWGLAYDGNHLTMSDGSSKVRTIDPTNFHRIKTIDVHFLNEKGKRRSIERINELEYVHNELWANVYQQNYIVRIDPSSGRILGEAINFSSLVPKSLRSNTEYVLNGLAFDNVKERLYVTGKCWSVIYVLSMRPKLVSVDENR